jgi:hypothetical protein
MNADEKAKFDKEWRNIQDKEAILHQSNLCWMCENQVCKVKPIVEESQYTAIIVTRCRYRIDKVSWP